MLKKSLSIVLFMFLICVGCRMEDNLEKKEIQTVTTEEVTEIKPNSTVSIIMAGDNLIHSSIYKQALARGNYENYNFDYAYQFIADTVDGYDLAILNQETPIANQNPSDYPMFNSPQEIGDKMLELGFNAFSHANNHILDKGESGLLQTLDYWNNKDVFVYGAYYNDEDLFSVKTMQINGITFSFIGVTEHTNGLSLNDTTQTAQLIYTSEKDKIETLINASKQISDVVIISAHWGNEGTNIPSQTQKTLANEWANMGADIIIGTHPHVIQEIEFIEKENGEKTFVAYSLGNFISAQDTVNAMLGQLVSLDIIKDGETGTISIEQVKAIPIVTHYTYPYKDITVYPLSEYSEELAKEHSLKYQGNNFSKEYLQTIVEQYINSEFL